MTKRLFSLLLIFTAVAPTGLPPVAVADDIDQDDAIRLKQAGEILPLESILATARQQHNGKVIGVELEQEHNTLIYEIKILDTDGVLWEMKINAKNGKLLQQEEDD